MLLGNGKEDALLRYPILKKTDLPRFGNIFDDEVNVNIGSFTLSYFQEKHTNPIIKETAKHFTDGLSFVLIISFFLVSGSKALFD